MRIRRSGIKSGKLRLRPFRFVSGKRKGAPLKGLVSFLPCDQLASWHWEVCVGETLLTGLDGAGDHGHLFMTLTSPVSLLRNGNETIIEKGQGLMKARD